MSIVSASARPSSACRWPDVQPNHADDRVAASLAHGDPRDQHLHRAHQEQLRRRRFLCRRLFGCRQAARAPTRPTWSRSSSDSPSSISPSPFLRTSGGRVERRVAFPDELGLYDAPGPRARRRELLLSAVAGVHLLVVLFVMYRQPTAGSNGPPSVGKCSPNHLSVRTRRTSGVPCSSPVFWRRCERPQSPP